MSQNEKTPKSEALTKHSKYYPNGEKRAEYYLNPDLLTDSISKIWYSNVQKKSERHYRNGNFYGSFTEWFKNGQLKFKGTTLYHNREGLCTAYYENSQKKYTGIFFRDYAIGKSTEFYANGNRLRRHNTKVIPNLEYISKHHTRIVIAKKDTFTFKKMRRLVTWFENGQKKKRLWYSKPGIQNYKKTKTWFANGQRKAQGSFRQKSGSYKEWYNNGQLKLECRNKNYVLDGTARFWYANGQLSSTQERKNTKTQN